MAKQSSEGRYWAERFAKIEELEKRTADRVIKELNAEYSKTLESLERGISYWYNRLALNNGITGPDALKEAKKLLTAAELKEFKWTVEEYIEHASDGETAVRFAREIENASARAHISRLEAIKLQTAMHVDYLTAVQTGMVTKMIGDVFTDSFYRTAYEMQRAAGIFEPFATIDTYAVKQAIEKPWSADGVGYSTRIWRNQEALKIRLNNELTQNIIRGQSPKKLITGFTEEFGVSRHQAARLIQTERAAAMSRANYDSYRATETEYYVIIATLDFKTSEICQDMDGKVFRIEDYAIGSTAPPFHPNCVMPDTVIASPDADAITRSYYSGDVIKFTAANGRGLTVTPNHIVLTSRGWVRAKNIVKGDKVVYYRGWDKLVIESNPTQNEGVPTIEKLFTSFFKSGTVPSVTMPATAKDFKGDVIKGSEVNIVFIDSLLRSEMDSSISKLLCDFSLVWAFKNGKPPLEINCSLAQLLFGAGLASDGIMCGFRIADILLSGTFAHHDLISLRKASHYRSRLIQSEYNNCCSDPEITSNSFNAFTGAVKHNNSASIKNFSSIGVSDNNPSLFKDAHNGLSAHAKGVGDFCNALSESITFDDVVSVERIKFSGHVYDISSQSTLYYSNGFLSSNCRSTTSPYYEGEELTGSRIYRDAEGNSQYTDEYVTYKEWKEKYVDNAYLTELGGVETSTGVKVQGISKHFVERANERGISIKNIRNTLTNPDKVGKIIVNEKTGKVSQRFKKDNVVVTVNPNTGNLITTHPIDKKRKIK